MNALLPISCLPPELLGHIFECYIDMVDWSLSCSKDRGSYDSDISCTWVKRVTHVCHRWREVALGTPTLWTYIRVGFGNLERIRVFLERAKETPLRIETYDADAAIPSLSLLSNHLHKANSMLLFLSNRPLDALLCRIVSSAPRLEQLTLSNPQYGRTLEAPLHFHPVFFRRCTTPRLKELIIYEYLVDWKTLPESLTRLEISYRYATDPVPGALSASEIAHALKRLPSLEHLLFSNIFSLIEETTLDIPMLGVRGRPIVKLARLKSLDISSSAHRCVQFLTCCDIPSSAFITLSLETWLPTKSEALHASGSWLSLTLKSLVPRTLFVEERKVHFVKEDIASTPATDKKSVIPLVPPSFFDFIAPWRTNDFSNILSDIYSYLPCAQLTTLMIEDAASFHPEISSWRSAISAMEALELLCVSAYTKGSSSTYDLVLHLLGCEPQTGDDCDSRIFVLKHKYILPKLRRIWLYNVTFRKRHELAGRDMTSTRELAAVLEERSKIYPLDALVIRRASNAGRRDIHTLENSTTVDWDKHIEAEPTHGSKRYNAGLSLHALSTHDELAEEFWAPMSPSFSPASVYHSSESDGDHPTYGFPTNALSLQGEAAHVQPNPEPQFRDYGDLDFY